VMFDNLPSSVGHIKGGKILALGVTTVSRADALLDVPSIGEAVTGYEANVFYGIAAPKGTPSEIVGKLHQAVSVVLADPRVKARFGELAARRCRWRLQPSARSLRTRPRSRPRWSSSPGSGRSDLGNAHGACR
jgi:tripartite-type tricarboxylate transporter receptor subunit TctC